MVPVLELPGAALVAPVDAMKPSTVTSRHWTRAGLDQPLRPIALRDGAQAVEVLHHDDLHCLVSSWLNGYPCQVPVYCGPAAPFPVRPAFARIGERSTQVRDISLPPWHIYVQGLRP
jgi:hypothetical protein